ncbi:MAG TPA: O-antigen ligase family protein [Candidatus Methanoperedens sp.]|nr:O-antigen ligase family protein [Candidatus Methanoperedens sp.]
MVSYLAILVVFLDYVRLDAFVPVLRVPVFLPMGVLALSLVSKGDVSYKEVLRLASTRWLLFYLFLLALSGLTAEVTLYAYQFFTGVIIYVAIYMLLARELDSLKKIKSLILVLVVGHLLMAALNPDVILHPEMRAYVMRAAPFLGDGNDFAWSVLSYMPLCLFLFVEARRRSTRALYGAFTVLLLLCIVGSSSRGAALGTMAGLFYLWAKSSRKLLGLVLIAAVIAGVVVIAPDAYIKRMESVRNYEEDGSAQGRLKAWGSAIRMAKEHPLLGVGAGHFSVAFGVDFRPEGVGRTEMAWLNAHSIYFKTLGELGFPGITFLLGIILSNVVANEKAMKRSFAGDSQTAQSLRRLCLFLNASIIGWAVDGAFLSGIKYPHLFILCAFSSTLRLWESRLSGSVVGGAQQAGTAPASRGDDGRVLDADSVPC